MYLNNVILEKWKQEASNSYARGNNTENDSRVLALIQALIDSRGSETVALVESITELDKKLKAAYDLIGDISMDINRFAAKNIP
jgi:kynureninase